MAGLTLDAVTPSVVSDLATAIAKAITQEQKKAKTQSDADKADKDKEAQAQKTLERATANLQRSLDRVAGGLLGTTQNLAAKGFQGTAEAARLDTSMMMLSRELAAIFRPVVQGLTYFADGSRGMLASLNGQRQNSLMATGVGFAAGYAIAGVPGGVLGASYANFLLGGGTNPNMNGYGGAAGFVSGAVLGSRAGPYGAAFGAGVGLYLGAGGGDYNKLAKQNGANSIAAGTGSVFAALLDTVTFGESRPWAERQLGGRPPSPDTPRTQSPFAFNPAMLEEGGTHFAIQEMGLRAMTGASDEGPLKPVVDVLLRIEAAILSAITGKSYSELVAAGQMEADRARGR